MNHPADAEDIPSADPGEPASDFESASTLHVSAVEVIAFAKPGVTVRPVSNSYDPRHSGLLTYFVVFAGPVKGAHASAWRPDYDQGV